MLPSALKRVKIGIRLESLGLPLRRALAEAARMDVHGVQLDSVGDLSPTALTQTGRRELRNLLRTHNLELTALGCPLRHGLDTFEDQQRRVEHVSKVLTLSFDLGPRIVVVQAGQVPEDLESPAGRVMTESVAALARHGDRVGATLALETGLESGEALAAFLGRFDTGALGVNLDPANLLMHGFNPVAAVGALRGRIVHSHAKDARRVSASRAAAEVPLGHGDIDWLVLLESLAEVEYRGWLTVERESGENRLADVTAGVTFLRRLLA
jgi:sugar phosphate isomerase/epimerase